MLQPDKWHLFALYWNIFGHPRLLYNQKKEYSCSGFINFFLVHACEELFFLHFQVEEKKKYSIVKPYNPALESLLTERLETVT